MRIFAAVPVALALLPALVAAAPGPGAPAIAEDPVRGIEGAAILERRSVSNGLALEVTCRVKILSKAGFGAATVSGLPGNVRDVTGRTISPDGTVTALARSEVFEITRLTARGLSIRETTFTLPRIEPGAVIEYAYTLPGPLGDGLRYHSDFLLQHRWFAVRQELRVPAALRWNVTMDSMNGVTVRHEAVGREHVFVTENAAAVPDEPMAPPAAERSAKIIFSLALPGVPSDSVGYWREATKIGISEAFGRLLIRPGLLEDTLKKLPGSRTADPLARLAAIHAEVLRIRNREVALAEAPEPRGGWPENRDAWAAFRNGSGSGHELAMILYSLLRADGWKWRAVLAADREWRLFHREVPSMHQFGGLLAEVRLPTETEPIWISVEHPSLPFRQIPWNLAGGAAWAVDLERGTGEEVTIPFPSAAGNRSYRSERWQLGKDGLARISADEYRSGGRAFERRAEIRAAGTEAWKAARRKSSRDRGETPLALEILHLEDSELDFAVHEEVDIPDLAEPLPGGRLELAPLRSRAAGNPFVSTKRTLPLSLHWPLVDEDEIVVVPPDGWIVQDLPVAVSRKTAAGTYSLSAERDEGNVVRIRRKFELRRAIAGADQYPAFRSLFEAAAAGDRQWSLVLAPGAATPSGN